MNKTIFVDFDGTVTRYDTCNAMVEAFARDGWQELSRLWEEKKLSTVDCANAIFKLFDAAIEDLKDLMDTMEVDGYFSEFLSFCREKGYKVYILSDGYDFNIRTILERYGLESVEYYANTLVYDSDKGFSIECPYESESCKACGTCKKDLMHKLKSEGSQVVYIGDAHSDMCPAAAADIVFAKDVLYDYCREQGLNAVRFDSFKDIIESGVL